MPRPLAQTAKCFTHEFPSTSLAFRPSGRQAHYGTARCRHALPVVLNPYFDVYKVLIAEDSLALHDTPHLCCIAVHVHSTHLEFELPDESFRSHPIRKCSG